MSRICVEIRVSTTDGKLDITPLEMVYGSAYAEKDYPLNKTFLKAKMTEITDTLNTKLDELFDRASDKYIELRKDTK